MAATNTTNSTNSTTTAAKKRITQATFDETVRENIEEFELSREDAVKDALNQFTSQGVDLSNICVSYHEGDEHWLHEVDNQLETLAACLENGSKDDLPADLNQGQALTALRALQTALTDANTEKASNAKKLIGSKQTVNMIARLWASRDPSPETMELHLLAMEVTQLLCSGPGGEESKDGFWNTSMLKLCKLAQAQQEVKISDSSSSADNVFLVKFLALVRVLCLRTEDNKVNFVRHGGLDLLLHALEAHGAERDVVCGACGALRAVTAVDDFRKDFSASHTHTRALMTKGAIPMLVQATQRFTGDLEVVAAGLAALRNLANNDESVGLIASEGGLEMAIRALEEHWSHALLAGTAIGLFRNVSANDKHKATLCQQGGAELMLKAMRKHAEEGKLQEHGLATMGAMALRSPENCRQLVGLGAVPVLLQALRQHAENSAIQRQGSLAVRNMVCRAPELVESFLEAGAEPLLRQAGRYQESVDEAYAALRDLKCEVKRLVIDQDTGKIKDAVEQFGSVQSSFRRIYESSHDIDEAVEAAINAPSNAYRF